MRIQEAYFICSTKLPQYFPKPAQPSFCFIGRSNVGKSSLINLLVGAKQLARISKTPGKTNKIHFYHINQSWYLIDMPGYGWAKVSQAQRQAWYKMIKSHCVHNQALVSMFLLIDASIMPQAIDLEFIAWLHSKALPFVIVFTKTDKKPSQIIQANILAFKTKVQTLVHKEVKFFVSSSLKKTGGQSILDYIEVCLLT